MSHQQEQGQEKAQGKDQEKAPETRKTSRWKVPLGLVATGVAGAAVLILRGCWHRKMSWPVRYQDHSYQVCLGCGIKRLFDEKAFRAYGPYSYDLNRLIARDTGKPDPEADIPQRRPA
jgi:hypothetical protein